MELKDYLRILRRRWWTVLLVAVAVFGVNYYLLQNRPVIYRATVDVIVKEPNDQYVIVSGGATSLWDSLSYETRLSLIRSEPVLAGVLVRCRDLYPGTFVPPAPGARRRVFAKVQPALSGEFDVREVKGGRPEAVLETGERLIETLEVDERRLVDTVAQLKGFVSWTKEKDSEIVTIAVTGGDADATGRLANAMASSVKSHIERDKLERVTRTRDLIQVQLEKAQREFSQLQQEIEQIHDSVRPRGDSAVPPLWTAADADAAAQRLTELKRRKSRLTAEIEGLDRALQQKSSPVPVGPAGARLLALRSTEEQIERELSRLKLERTEAHPDVQAKIVELNDVRKHQREVETVSRRDAALDDRLLKSDRLCEFHKESALLTREIAETEAEVKEKRAAVRSVASEILPFLTHEQRQKLATLEFTLEMTKRTITEWLTVERELSTQVGLQIDPVALVAVAKPGSPLPQAGGASVPFILIVGVALGLGAAGALEYMNTTVRTEQDVKRYVNLPILGMILRIPKPEDRLLLNVPVKSTLHEIFNTIGALLETYAQEHQAKVFMIASSRAEEGKSTVTSNIGIALARSGARVLLVDCDLRKAVLHRFFSLDNTKGLSTWISESSDADAPVVVDELARPTEVEGLRVMTAGPHPQNPVGLIKSDRFRHLLQAVRDQCDIVLIDVPPVNIAVDTMLLAPYVDGVGLLISAGETNKDEIAHAKRLVESARGKFIGCILNKVTVETHGYYYYYYYYDSYKYYRER